MRRAFEKVKPALAVSDDGVRVFSSGQYQWTVQYDTRKIRIGHDMVEDQDGFLSLVSLPWPGRKWEFLDGSEGSEMTDEEREQVRLDFELGLTALNERWKYRDEPLRHIV